MKCMKWNLKHETETETEKAYMNYLIIHWK